MRSFVRWHGEVPVQAERLDERAARAHTATWIQRTIAKGVAGSYVIGFALGTQWWTFFFERERRSVPAGAEGWRIESYAHNGRSWADPFLYWPAELRWRHDLHLERGENHGRFPT